MRHVQQIHYAGGDGVDDFIHGGGQMIEAGIGGADDSTGLCDGEHVFDLDKAQGHFAVDEDEFAAFLQADVGGAGDEVVADAVGDFGEFVIRAGDDDHAVGFEGAGGDGCADVFIRQERDAVVGSAGEARDIEGSAAFQAEFIVEESAAEGGDDQEDFDG